MVDAGMAPAEALEKSTGIVVHGDLLAQKI